MGVALGLDVGERRIGVALSDALGILATPLTTIVRTSDRAAIEAIAELAARHGAEVIVVGLPLSAEGQLTAQARRNRAFARRLEARLRATSGARVVCSDERLSTATATARLLEAAGGRWRPRSAWEREAARRRLDAAAAAVILQEYLDQHQPQHEPESRPCESSSSC
jgi:putative Holliday junction resolvase